MHETINLGRLIVIEGPDGVGKSTLSRALTDRLKAFGLACDHISFPGMEAGTLGQLVYEIHHRPTAYGLDKITAIGLQAMHVAAHLDAIEQRILPALRRGRWIVLDRFWWSTWVYGNTAGADISTLAALIQTERVHWHGSEPDALFLIDRTNTDAVDGTDPQLRASYITLAEDPQNRFPVHRINNDSSVDDALNQLLGVIGEFAPLDRKIPFIAPTVSDRQPKDQMKLSSPRVKSTTVLTKLSPAVVTPVYETFWRFAVERQEVFFRKLKGTSAPWTDDPIIARHKFTNAYRASDRVSQFLIKRVIYRGAQTADEVFFRTILFKLFNKIETWQMLEARLGTIRLSQYSFGKFDEVLTEALDSGSRIYSAAYIMPSGRTAFGHRYKHRNHLSLLERMMDDAVGSRIADAPSMSHAFELLRSYPSIGNFLAYQFVTDLNYSNLTDFSEMEFVVPGPGALDGIKKCFTDLGGLNEAEIIKMVTERQEKEFERHGLTFSTLGDRSLQLIDCQNLFCEVSKYARVKHPDVKGLYDRTRIKQIYRPSATPIDYWYPPKWGINHLIPSRPRSMGTGQVRQREIT